MQKLRNFEQCEVSAPPPHSRHGKYPDKNSLPSGATDYCQEYIRALFAPIFVARQLNPSSIRPPYASMERKSPRLNSRQLSDTTLVCRVPGGIRNAAGVPRSAPPSMRLSEDPTPVSIRLESTALARCTNSHSGIPVWVRESAFWEKSNRTTRSRIH